MSRPKRDPAMEIPGERIHRTLACLEDAAVDHAESDATNERDTSRNLRIAALDYADAVNATRSTK